MTASEMRAAYEVSDMFIPKDSQGNPIDLNSKDDDKPASKPALSARHHQGRDKGKAATAGGIPWEVLLGSTHRLAPKDYLEQIGQLWDPHP